MRKIAPLMLLTAATLFSCTGGMKEFKTLKSGVKYKIVDDKKGDKKAVVGSMITMNITTKLKDSVLFESMKQNNGQPIETPVNAPMQSGDIMEVFPELTEGDSVIIEVPVDSLFKGGQPLPPFMKSGDNLSFYVKLISVKSKEEFEKSKLEASKKQLEIDDKAINDYLTKNNLKANKTASGLYYIINTPGSGPNASAGKMITMNYTGMLLDGTKFDSNEDPAFQHPQAFEFTLGQGMVIKGWDEGIALMNVGTKATLIIPSPLAYGERSMPGSEANPKGIPANSPLVFNVEVKAIKDAPAEASAPAVK
ncbi:MAG: FKBP-type peptidyl-prolyl cis-trans isomerase [Chitinophagaceae bacterium]|nr:FKBP-type peptidyl-prolyl cis-trans isomerase [Chitinophagaceae bacterium]